MKQSQRSEVVYKRTYARPKPDGKFENWPEIVNRVIKHQTWIWERAKGCKLDEAEQSELEEFRQLMLDFKVCSSGRTLWMADQNIAKKREIAHFNCCFLKLETVRDFVDAFWLLLQGAGVGFKCTSGYLNGFMRKIEDIEIIPSTKKTRGGNDQNTETFDPETGVWTIQVGDSAEAWAKSIGKLLAGKYPAKKLVLDFSQIRAEGVRLKGYGWISAGYKPLAKAYEGICKILNRKVGCLLSKMDMLDIANHLGQTLSSRRSAQICLFDHNKPEWEELAAAKVDYWMNNPHRASSNNTLMFWRKPERKEMRRILDMMVANGGSEPGMYNAEAAAKRAPWFTGTNPCFTGDQELLCVEDNKVKFRTFAELDGRSTIDIYNVKTDCYCTGYVFQSGTKPVFEYTLTNGVTVTCTNDHVFQVLSDKLNFCGIAPADTIQNIYDKQVPMLYWDVEGCEYHTVYVKSCKAKGMQEVYDFSMESHHWGIVNGLSAHNCGEVLLNDGGICNLTEINLVAFKDDMAALQRAAYIVARANYRQTAVSLKDDILQEKWHVNNEFLRLCGVGITGLCQRPDITPHDLRTLRREATYGAYSMADELGLQRPKNVSVVKPSGCRPLDAITSTDSGLLTLDEILADHPSNKDWCDITDLNVYQENGLNRVTKSFRNGEAPTKLVNLAYGLSIESTLDHPWHVHFMIGSTRSSKNRKTIDEFIKTNELQPGHVLTFNTDAYRKITPSKLMQLPEQRVCTNSTVIKQPTVLTDELCWLFGYFYGDGCLSPNKYRVRLCDDNLECISRAKSILESEFDVPVSVSYNSSKNSYDLTVASINLYSYFKLNGIDKSSGIPKCVRMSSRRHIQIFLTGLFDSDGCFHSRVNKDNNLTCTLSTAYDDKAKLIQDVSWSVGMCLSRSLNTKGTNKQAKKHIWLMNITTHLTQDALDVIKDFSLKYRQIKESTGYDFAPVGWTLGSKHLKVISIEDSQSYTADIEVENSHWYYAGFIKSHNTIGKVFGCTEGAHKPLGKYIINNIVFGRYDPLVPKLKKAGYHVRQHPFDETAVLASFPVAYEGVQFDKVIVNGREVEVNLETAIEQLERYKMVMENWCDQNCSITVSYSPDEIDDIVDWLDRNWDSYVGVSFMLRNDPTKTAEDLGHPYLPQEVVTKEEFDIAMKGISPIDFDGTDSFDEIDAGSECAGGSCPIR